MSKSVRLPAVVLSVGLLLGCASSDEGGGTPVEPPGPPSPDAVAGRIAFEQECASCHNSRDGFDLAYFSYPDSTIVRRAVAHVDTATALRIVAYIRTLNTPHAHRDLVLFQPGGSTVAGDVEFAVALFGKDEWPAGLTAAQLKAIDPLKVRIGLPLLVWSREGSNLDWLPDFPPSPTILAYDGNRAAKALDAYYASSTVANLDAAVEALLGADHAQANPDAPCMFFVSSRVDYRECFEVRRWTSTLVAQHMLRHGVAGQLRPGLHNLWWEVGDVARRSRGKSGQLSNTVQNWARWMYLGWMFDPANVPAIYTTGGMAQLGLPRHSTFLALRSLVARPPGVFLEDVSVYMDFLVAAQAVPNHWAGPAASLGLRNILDRVNAGDRPLAGTEATRAAAQLDQAMNQLAGKVSAADLAALTTLVGQIKARL